MLPRNRIHFWILPLPDWLTSHEYFLDTFTLPVFSSTATPTSLLLWSKSQIEKYSVERMFLLCGGRCSFEAKLFGPILGRQRQRQRQRSEDVVDGSIGGKPSRYCHIELLFGEMYLMCINYMLLFILNSTGSGAHSLCIIPFLSKCI